MLFELFATCIILCFFLLYRWRPPNGMPPGEWGWPVCGYIPLDDVPITERIECFKKKHGKIFSWRMGTRTFVFLCDFYVLKKLFATPESTYRPKIYSFDLYSDFKRLGFANNIGQPWKNIRRFTYKVLRDSGVGKSSIENIILKELQCLIEDIKKNYIGYQTEVPWSLNVAVINVLWKIVADRRYNVEDKDIQDFEKLVTDIFNDAQSNLVILFDLFPAIIPFVPDTVKSWLGLRGTFHRISRYQKFFKEAIDDHQKTLDEENPRDFIDAFLIEMKRNEQGQGDIYNTNFVYEELLFTLSDLFGAGSETSSSTIRWVLLFLAKYPVVQEKVHSEIDNVVPLTRMPSIADRDKLNYTYAVIHEAMRLAPIAPLGAYHTSPEDISVNSFKIPKNTILVSAIMSCHLDTDYWENPTEFCPERFLNPDGTIDTKKDGFIPFSTGRRSCIGESLARTKIFLFVAGLLQHFSFTAPPGEELITTPDVGKPFFMIPNPFKIIIKERFP